MRLKLSLSSNQKSLIIPVNYQYPLSAAIYKLLNRAEPQFADMIHSKGYPTQHNRRFKFFTFSKLFFKSPPKIHNNLLLLDNHGEGYFFLSSPLNESFVKNFIIGIFESQEIAIGLKNICHTTFKIEMVESMPAPAFTDSVYCKAISPISVSQPSDREQPDYLRALDQRLTKAIKENLLWKYRTLYETEPEEQDIIFEIGKDYVQKAGGEQRVSKLIKIKEGEPEGTSIKAFVAPFRLEGSVELIKLAYECGIGEKNSLGFGMFDVI